MLLLEFTQGYAGEDLPHSLYSSNVGTFPSPAVGNGGGPLTKRGVMVGDQALSFRRDGMDVTPAFDADGLVANWEAYEGLLAHAYTTGVQASARTTRSCTPSRRTRVCGSGRKSGSCCLRRTPPPPWPSPPLSSLPRTRMAATRGWCWTWATRRRRRRPC
eukprot:contig_39801_g9183